MPSAVGRWVADPVRFLSCFGSADDVIDVAGTAQHFRDGGQRRFHPEVASWLAGDGSGKCIVSQLGNGSASLPIRDDSRNSNAVHFRNRTLSSEQAACRASYAG